MARLSTLLPRVALGLLTGSAFFAALTSDAEAFSVKKTSKGELVHWEESLVQYTIDSSVDVNVADGSRATLRAMGSWSGTVGAPDLQTKAADGESPKAPSFDHKNGVFFMKNGYTPAGRALAITVLTYDNQTGKIMDADVIVNGIYNFQVLAAPSEATKATLTAAPLPGNTDTVTHADEGSNNDADVYDLHHVVAHELGHSLGMNDELGRSDALMYRYSEPNDATMRQPAPDDIAGLAELYANKTDAQGNGCGSATVAPKKPSRAASNLAAYASFGFLLFLVLRARSDRRARVAFVVAAAAATVALVPSLSGKRGAGVARASEGLGVGHARAMVLDATTSIDGGLFKTSYRLATTSCNVGGCPKAGHGETWGGTIGNITQDVGGYYAPRTGDAVDISFATLPSVLTTLSKPLAGRPSVTADAAVRVLTQAAR